MTISAEQKMRAVQALRAAGFTPAETRELLAGPKTLRDDFAGQAMTAIVAASDWTSPHCTFSQISRDAYEISDAMMVRRG